MRQLILAVVVLSTPAVLHAQWRATLLAGSATSHGDARNATDPEQPQLRADRPATFRFGLSSDHAAWRLGVDIHHTGADLAEVSATSVVATLSALKAWGAGVEIARRIAGRSDGAMLLVGVGGTFDRWSFDLDNASTRWRLAGRGSLETDYRIGGRWSAVVRGELSAGPSVFTADEIPEDFTRQSAVRIGLLVGVTRMF
jgi:hypothetical protein